ncbi:MAG TPA: TIGR04563 family protein [Myxococcales bacterium]|nr:TIGR04563 family protein [Myxococcales bacterium]
MSANDARKQSLYFPEEMLAEIQAQAQRLDRSLSWVVQQAWKIAKNDLHKVPSPNDMLDDDPNAQRR